MLQFLKPITTSKGVLAIALVRVSFIAPLFHSSFLQSHALQLYHVLFPMLIELFVPSSLKAIAFYTNPKSTSPHNILCSRKTPEKTWFNRKRWNVIIIAAQVYENQQSAEGKSALSHRVDELRSFRLVRRRLIARIAGSRAQIQCEEVAFEGTHKRRNRDCLQKSSLRTWEHKREQWEQIKYWERQSPISAHLVASSLHSFEVIFRNSHKTSNLIASSLCFPYVDYLFIFAIYGFAMSVAVFLQLGHT